MKEPSAQQPHMQYTTSIHDAANKRAQLANTPTQVVEVLIECCNGTFLHYFELESSSGSTGPRPERE